MDTVRTWRGRFAYGGITALTDRRRSGRPARFTPAQVAEAKAPARQLQAESGLPLSRWSCPELAAALTARGITDSISASTARRWLRQDALKPWQYRPGSSSAPPPSAPRLSGSLTCPTLPPRRPPGRDVRALRSDHRHRAVHEPRRAGHDLRALRRRETRLLGR
ncbi:helix-turn-helix domain-containing protein [Streptomyces sp. NPDC127584]|uniref:helix-turn-helix domain-containing protein n=1 Tax=Streptomyces sp. NPDC127584 TaxID=3345403 RepID=UPI0036340A38